MGRSPQVAIANGRMRSLKQILLDLRERRVRRCNSEWPYEVTETIAKKVTLRHLEGVAIANGRMRSLKLPCRFDERKITFVAIANGRMRSLKHGKVRQQVAHLFALQ